MKSPGIAIGGRKAAGKDETLACIEEILRANNVEYRVLRCKTPIVAEYERLASIDRGEPVTYDKSHDADLMRYSRDRIRLERPFIVAEYLWKEMKDNAVFTLIPDMRFAEENATLYDSLGAFCLHIHASDAVRRERTLKRDGHLLNFLPDDPTERSVEQLKYHHTICNEGRIEVLRLQVRILMLNQFGIGFE